jgi:hypothetical protein
MLDVLDFRRGLSETSKKKEFYVDGKEMKILELE